LSSHQDAELVNVDRGVLEKYGFPKGEIDYRHKGEEYKDVVRRINPDIIVEDDCQSIGGFKKTVYFNIESKVARRIKSIVVKEFQGIDHLPEEISQLVNYSDS
jgi:hypothetical protein